MEIKGHGTDEKPYREDSHGEKRSGSGRERILYACR
jgi:hypothetical protein